MAGTRGVRSALVGNYAALAIALVSQVVLLPLLLGRVGPSVAGTFVLLWSAVNFAAIGIGWLSSGGVVLMTRAAAENDVGLVAIIYRRFALIMGGYALVVWLALGCWSLGVGSVWLRSLSPDDVRAVRWATQGAGAYVVAMYAHQADLALLTATLQQGRAAIFRACLQALMFAGALAGIGAGAGVAGMFAGYAVAAVLTAAIAHLSVRARGFPRSVPAADATRGTTREILGTFAGYSVVAVLAQYSDVAIVGALGGPETTIVYAFLQRLPDAAALLVGRGSESLGPYFTTLSSRGESTELTDLFLTSGRVVWRTAAVAGAGFAVFGKDLVEWWSHGKLTLPSDWYFAGAGLLIMATIVNRHAALLAYYSRRTGDATRLAAAELVIRVLLVLVFFSRAREQAPMVAALAAQFGLLVFAYRRLECRILGVTLRRVLDACIRPAIVTAAIAASTMLALRWSGRADGRTRAMAPVVAAACSIAILFAQERELGRSLLRRRAA